MPHPKWVLSCGVDVGKNVNEGEWPDGESQLDSLSFGVASLMGLRIHYHSTKLGGFPSHTEDLHAY